MLQMFLICDTVDIVTGNSLFESKIYILISIIFICSVVIQHFRANLKINQQCGWYFLLGILIMKELDDIIRPSMIFSNKQ